MYNLLVFPVFSNFNQNLNWHAFKNLCFQIIDFSIRVIILASPFKPITDLYVFSRFPW